MPISGSELLARLKKLGAAHPEPHGHYFAHSSGPTKIKLEGKSHHDILKELQNIPHRMYGMEMPVGLSPFLKELAEHSNSPVFRPEEGVIQYISRNPKAGALEIGGFYGDRAVPMTDIDIPDATHPESGITAQTRGHAIEQLERLIKMGKGLAQRVYITPGGIRSFEMGATMPPSKWWKGHEVGDPFYRRFTTAPRGLIEEGKLKRMSPTFTFRNSPKLNREPGSDYVAALLGTLGEEAAQLPESVRKVTRYHDARIDQSRDPKAAAQLATNILNVLQEMPANLQEQVKRRYGL